MCDAIVYDNYPSYTDSDWAFRFDLDPLPFHLPDVLLALRADHLIEDLKAIDPREFAVAAIVAEKGVQLAKEYSLDADRATSAFQKLVNSQVDFLPKDLFDLRDALTGLSESVLEDALMSFPAADGVLEAIEQSEPSRLVQSLCLASRSYRLADEYGGDADRIEEAFCHLIGGLEWELPASAAKLIDVFGRFPMTLIQDALGRISPSEDAIALIMGEDPVELIKRSLQPNIFSRPTLLSIR